MRLTTAATLAFLLLSSSLFAQPKAIIAGPTEAPPGEGVMLTSEGSSGDNLRWVMPDGLAVFMCDNSKLFFSTMKQGKYEFLLIAADNTAAIDYTKHTVVIGTPTTPPPEEIPPQPIPAPPLTAPNDPATTVLLKQIMLQVHTNIQAMCDTGACPDLNTGSNLYKEAIEEALLTRPRGSQADWFTWRKDINNYIEGISPTKIGDLQQAMKAVVDSL